MYQISFTKRAEKDLSKINAKIRKRIIRKIELLENDPLQGKVLSGKFKGLRVLRIWPYRVIYKVEKRLVVVMVLRILHRQGVYK